MKRRHLLPPALTATAAGLCIMLVGYHSLGWGMVLGGAMMFAVAVTLDDGPLT